MKKVVPIDHGVFVQAALKICVALGDHRRFHLARRLSRQAELCELVGPAARRVADPPRIGFSS
jgi:hypothetical protein